MLAATIVLGLLPVKMCLKATNSPQVAATALEQPNRLTRQVQTPLHLVGLAWTQVSICKSPAAYVWSRGGKRMANAMCVNVQGFSIHVGAKSVVAPR